MLLPPKQRDSEAQNCEAQRSNLQAFPPYPTAVSSIPSSRVPVVRARSVAIGGLNVPLLLNAHRG